MNELAGFHYSRRRRTAQVFDFDRASVQLLAFIKARHAEAGHQRLARFGPDFGAIVQVPDSVVPPNAQHEKVL